MKVEVETEEKENPAASQQSEAGNDSENNGDAGNTGENGSETPANRKSADGGGAPDLEKLINAHRQAHPEEEEEEEAENPAEPAQPTPEQTLKDKKDTERNKILTKMFINTVLLRFANMLLTFLNCMAFNAIMKSRGKHVDFEKVLLTEKELNPANELVAEYGESFIQKYLPPWLQTVLIIQATFVDKMILASEDISKT